MKNFYVIIINMYPNINCCSISGDKAALNIDLLGQIMITILHELEHILQRLGKVDTNLLNAINNFQNINPDGSDYWTTLKRRLMKVEGSKLPTICRKLKIRAQDGKMRETNTLDTEGIFRLIESISSSKAEPFKIWLARLGKKRITKR